MAEHANEMPGQHNSSNPALDYVQKAAEACASGDFMLGMHLYLAAYEKAVADSNVPSSVEVSALREAWMLACDSKERSLAEYVFEKLEPYLTGEEIASCAMKLQELALDRLEEYGFSREELEDMAESISQDLMGDGAQVVKVESVSIPNMGMFGVPGVSAEATIVERARQADAPAEPAVQADAPAEPAVQAGEVEVSEPELAQPNVSGTAQGRGSGDAKPQKPNHVEMGVADVGDFNPYDEYRTSSVGKSYHAATNEGAGSYVFTRDEDRATEAQRAATAKADGESAPAKEEASAAPTAHEQTVPADDAHDGSAQVELARVSARLSASPAGAPQRAAEAPAANDGVLSYRNLVGYDDAISLMRDFGVGLSRDPAFISFVRMMNSRHGLNRMPAVDTLLFRAPVLEDATRFVEATAGELGLPVLRMSMEEGVGGAPVLCVTAQGNNRPRMNHAHNRFDGPGILVIDDLDAWVMPEMPEAPEGFAGFMMANISRGAREAVNLIRSAVEDPDVYVLATASTMAEPDPFFYELLEPITIVDIANPNEKERADIWAEIAEDHPSTRGVDRGDLVRFTEGMARYDMYMAAREAVEDAYKTGLVRRMYVPVTPQNLFDKIAACHPLDSDLYRGLEQAVVDDFLNDLDHLEDLLGE